MQTPPINAVHGVNALDANTVPIAGAVQTLSNSEDTIQTHNLRLYRYLVVFNVSVAWCRRH